MINVFRGKDSTGVVRISAPSRKGGIVQSKRAVMSSPEFITHKAGSSFIWDEDKKEAKDHSATMGFLGHCRAATKGSVKPTNAHPFRFDHTLGVHNGTIRWKFKGSDDYETDSEALYALINNEGIESALNQVKNADPAYALAWVDTKEKTLNFIKNDKRPLYFTYIFGKSTLVWSSTQKMLDFALDMRPHRPQTTSWAPDVGKDGLFTLKDHTLLSIPIGKSPQDATLTAIPVEKATVRTYSGVSTYSNWGAWDDYEGYDSGVVATVTSEGSSSNKDGYGNFREKHDAEALSSLPWLDEQEEVQTSSKTATSEKSKGADKGTAVVVHQGSSKEFRANQHRGEPVSQSERNFRLAQGCICCGTPVSPSDTAAVARVRWWNREHFACGDCYENVDGDTDWVAIALDDEIAPHITAGVAVH